MARPQMPRRSFRIDRARAAAVPRTVDRQGGDRDRLWKHRLRHGALARHRRTVCEVRPLSVSLEPNLARCRCLATHDASHSGLAFSRQSSCPSSLHVATGSPLRQCGRHSGRFTCCRCAATIRTQQSSAWPRSTWTKGTVGRALTSSTGTMSPSRMNKARCFGPSVAPCIGAGRSVTSTKLLGGSPGRRGGGSTDG